MLIVISSPHPVNDEIEAVKRLLSEGLGIFHLRKPDYSADDLRNYLQNFHQDELRKLVIHQQYELTEEFDLKGFHFSSRQLVSTEEVLEKTELLKSRQQTTSASFHKLEEAESYPVVFNYIFLSPVFHSISKQDYMENITLRQIPDFFTQCPIALGGINQDNIGELKSSGYAGVAVLGALWKEYPENIKELSSQFIRLKKAAEETEFRKNGRG